LLRNSFVIYPCHMSVPPHHLQVPNVMKSGSLHLLEPSGPYRACYGTPLPLYVRTTLIWAIVKPLPRLPLVINSVISMFVLILQLSSSFMGL
jgi:hypothetical protein